MTRLRYWKLTPDEMEKFTYPEENLLNWEIKCIRAPEDEARFIGVYLYRRGTPLDYELARGIVYYHNNMNRDELESITGFLKERYGGERAEKGERIFLKDSKAIYAPRDIAGLARDLESRFDLKPVISLEFHEISEETARQAGLPEAKLLPIPGK